MWQVGCAGIVLVVACSEGSARGEEIVSPGGDLTVSYRIADVDGTERCFVYSVAYKGKPILADSRLGLILNGTPLVGGLGVVRKSTSQHDSTWKPLYGERSTVRDRYRQTIVELREGLLRGPFWGKPPVPPTDSATCR